MIWNLTEYLATIIECLICADFMVKFLKCNDKHKVLSCYLLIVCTNSIITFLFNHLMIFEGILCLFRIIANFIISLILLKGTIYKKMFAALISDIIILLINFITLNLFSVIFNLSMLELVNERGMIRLITLFVTKFLFFLVTRLLINFEGNYRYTFSFVEWLMLSIVFFITMYIGLVFFRFILMNDSSTETPTAISVGIGLILINVFVYILMIRINLKNTEHTELLIDKMQMELYKTQLKESEKQYDEMRKIRHDMKNHLQCIAALLSENEIVNAKDYINEMLINKLDFGYQNIKTGNRVIDIISNTKLSQCRNENIKTIVNISFFKIDIDDVDMCVILGNLFDNAIEECKKIAGEKIVYFEISQKKSYINLVIKNTISKRILEDNPELKTTKSEKNIHGIGLKSVKDVVKKYDGMIELYEENDNFIVDVWLPSINLT